MVADDDGRCMGWNLWFLNGRNTAWKTGWLTNWCQLPWCLCLMFYFLCLCFIWLDISMLDMSNWVSFVCMSWCGQRNSPTSLWMWAIELDTWIGVSVGKSNSNMSLGGEENLFQEFRSYSLPLKSDEHVFFSSRHSSYFTLYFILPHVFFIFLICSLYSYHLSYIYSLPAKLLYWPTKILRNLVAPKNFSKALMSGTDRRLRCAWWSKSEHSLLCSLFFGNSFCPWPHRTVRL